MIPCELLPRKRVLLLDPDPWTRDSLSLLFQYEECPFRAFDNVEDGFRALETERFDIILCSHWMPGMDGISFLERGRDTQPGAIRILVAPFPFAEISDVATGAGIHDCIQKPLTLDAIEDALSRASAFLQNRSVAHS